MSKVICRNEDGYGNVEIVEYDVPDFDDDEDATDEEILDAVEGVI